MKLTFQVKKSTITLLTAESWRVAIGQQPKGTFKTTVDIIFPFENDNFNSNTVTLEGDSAEMYHILKTAITMLEREGKVRGLQHE